MILLSEKIEESCVLLVASQVSLKIMFPKNINILGHCVHPKTENNFDLIDTFPNDQSEADKIHKNYKKPLWSTVFNLTNWRQFFMRLSCYWS